MCIEHVARVVYSMGNIAYKAKSREYAVMTSRERKLIANLNGFQNWEDLKIETRFEMMKAFSNGFHSSFKLMRLVA